MNAGQDGRDGTSRTVGRDPETPHNCQRFERRDEEIAQRGGCVDGLYPRGKGRTVG
jgi:hypothetical protein